jgi:alkylresorcinol/alkylpyrone synthase
MSKIISTGTSTPSFEYSQNEIRKFISALFMDSSENLSEIFTVFDTALISRRFFSVPKEWLYLDHTFSERNRQYQETALDISEKACIACIEVSGARFSDIDGIIFVSSTGIATPGIDAMLCNKLNLRPDIKRIPLWGLGCAGGASGLSLAMSLCKANPEQCFMLVCTELCSICFQKEDISKKNIVATSLFADGSAAALIAGEGHSLYQQKGISLIESRSRQFRDTLDVMGWNIIDSGFDVVISKDIPCIVLEHIRAIVTDLLRNHDLVSSDLKHLFLHPGGRKVLEAVSAGLERPMSDFSSSSLMLDQYGNMSSATVLFVIDEVLRNSQFQKNEFGMISAFGPGFSSETLLCMTS